MIPKSVRWRLPLSYAAIAVLAAVALGLVLLTTLAGYYRQQELDYLASNAQAIGSSIAPLWELDLPSTELQSQLHSLAFLSQTRVRLLDTEMQALADTGTPRAQQEVVTLTREAVMLDIRNAEEMPDTPADVGGLVVQRENHTLLVGTGNLSGTLVDSEWQLTHDGPVLVDGEWQLAHDGPVVEVVVRESTVMYRDDTLQQLGGVAPSGPIEQLLRPGSLAEIARNGTVQAWGEWRGDRLVADVIVFSPNTLDDPSPPERPQGGATSEAEPGAMIDEPPAVILESTLQQNDPEGNAATHSVVVQVLPASSAGIAQPGSDWSAQGVYRVSRYAVATPYGFSLDAEAQWDERRSAQLARRPFYGPQGELWGYIELSEGPAYGRQILASVARGWALAGVVAAILAALAGWLASRRITSPLLALAQVTASMAAGDLGARADVGQEDEFSMLARSFNRMADRVQRMVDTLRAFVSDAAHELNTPLATLRANLEMVQDGPLGQDRRIARAQAQVERLEAMTAGMLDLSRIESSTSQEAFATVSLSALVQELGEMYAYQADQAGLCFEMSLPKVPVSIWGDEALLRRGLTNLLDNAFKFTPQGGRVWLGLRQEDGMMVLWVEDTGIGILEEDLPHLFRRFHRGRNTAAYPGNGLGLAIVEAIAERHHGQVQAQNTQQGAKFTLRIPCI